MGKGKGLLPESPSTVLRNRTNTSPSKTSKNELLGFFFNVKSLSVNSQFDVETVESHQINDVAATKNIAVELIESTPITEDMEEESYDSLEDFDYYDDGSDYDDLGCDSWMSLLENKKRGNAIKRSKLEDRDQLTQQNRKTEARIVRSNGSAHISAAASRKESARATQISIAISARAANTAKKNFTRRNVLPPPTFVPTPAAPARPNYSRNPASRDRRPRQEELSPEDQQVAAAIRASLAENSQAFGGLTYQQLLELQTRDLTPEDYERLLMLDNTVKPKTLDEDMISKFARSKVCAVHHDQLCTVCQMNYADGEEILTLKCGHYFHADCITQWLSNSSTKCPIDGLSLKD